MALPTTIAYDDRGKVISCYGLTVPADASKGYATGCVFHHTDATGDDDVLYINQGDPDSCNFDPLPDLSISADLASVANGKGASLIGFEDAAGKTTSATVEAALAELFNRQYGSIYLSATAETTISAQGSGGLAGDGYVKCAGTTTALNLNGFDMPANNRLRYTGTPDRHLHIAISISQITASNNQVLAFKLAKNGTVQDPSYLPRKQGTGADVGSTAMHYDLMVSTNDYLELFVANETSATNMTLQAMYMFALAMPV